MSLVSSCYNSYKESETCKEIDQAEAPFLRDRELRLFRLGRSRRADQGSQLTEIVVQDIRINGSHMLRATLLS